MSATLTGAGGLAGEDGGVHHRSNSRSNLDRAILFPDLIWTIPCYDLINGCMCLFDLSVWWTRAYDPCDVPAQLMSS